MFLNFYGFQLYGFQHICIQCMEQELAKKVFKALFQDTTMLYMTFFQIWLNLYSFQHILIQCAKP